MASKKGFSTTWTLFAFIFFALFAVFILGILYYMGSTANSVLESVDLTVGNQSFHDAYEETLGAGFDAGLSNLSNIALGLLLGMIVLMLVVGYMSGGNTKIMIIADIAIIVVVFMTSVYLTQSFDSFINSNEEFFIIYSEEFENASRIVLNLPIYVAVVGALIIIVTYAAKRKKEPEVVSFSG